MAKRNPPTQANLKAMEEKPPAPPPPPPPPPPDEKPKAPKAERKYPALTADDIAIFERAAVEAPEHYRKAVHICVCGPLNQPKAE